MWFNINQRSHIPIYQQLVDGVKEAVAKGILNAGDRLPSVRELAAQITINPNTIAKAYQEMEREGIIETLRGRGTFVADRGTRESREQNREVLRVMLEKVLIEAFYLQVGEEEMVKFTEEAVRSWYRERRESK